jgi:hypothetical protein
MKQTRVQIVGMTLVEVVVVCGISTVLMLAIMSMVAFLYQTNAYTMAQAQEVDTARRGMTAWTGDAREMVFSANGTFPVARMGSTTMGFYSDIDSDNMVEYVEYRLATTTLYKFVYSPVGSPPTYPTTTPEAVFTLSEFVQNASQNIPIFQYYNRNGTLLSSTSSLLTDVRYIRAQIIVNIDPIRSPGEFMLRSSVAPRNLKDNL